MGRIDNEYFEDADLKRINDAFYDQKINFNTWVNAVHGYIDKRNKEHKFWGFKDPRAILLVPTIHCFIDGDVKFIICERNRSKTITSMINNTKWDLKTSAMIYDMRKRAIENFTRGRNPLHVNFDLWRDQSYVVEAIRSHFKI